MMDIQGMMNQMMGMHRQMMNNMLGGMGMNMPNLIEDRKSLRGDGNNSRALTIPGMGGGIGALLNMNPEDMSNNSNGGTFFYSSSQSFNSNDPSQNVTKTTTSRIGPGGVRETRTQVRDGRDGTEKLGIRRQMGDQMVQEEKIRNADGQEETRQIVHNVEDDDAERFKADWQRKTVGKLPDVHTTSTSPMVPRVNVVNYATPDPTPSMNNVTVNRFPATAQPTTSYIRIPTQQTVPVQTTMSPGGVGPTTPVRNVSPMAHTTTTTNLGATPRGTSPVGNPMSMGPILRPRSTPEGSPINSVPQRTLRTEYPTGRSTMHHHIQTPHYQQQQQQPMYSTTNNATTPQRSIVYQPTTNGTQQRQQRVYYMPQRGVTSPYYY